MTWELAKLPADLAAKQQETFRVHAITRSRAVDEEFCYLEVMHTQTPMVPNFATLVEASAITVDHLLHQEGERACDHGYLFKIRLKDVDTLFPPPEVHALA